MIPVTDDKKMLGYELLSSHPNISHFVTTRHGGVGKGKYGTFNCSPYCGDDPLPVGENQKRLCSALNISPERLIFPHQVHDTKIAVINTDYPALRVDEKMNLLDGVDAVINRIPGYCLCVSTADCVPVLLYDDKNRVVAAIHAGWRGTVNKIVSRTLSEMHRMFGSDGKTIYAAIGPSISKEAFEVGDEVYHAFKINGFTMNEISFRNPESGKYHFDLWQAN